MSEYDEKRGDQVEVEPLIAVVDDIEGQFEWRGFEEEDMGFSRPSSYTWMLKLTLLIAFGIWLLCALHHIVPHSASESHLPKHRHAVEPVQKISIAKLGGYHVTKRVPEPLPELLQPVAKQANGSEVCTTPACKAIAEEFIANMAPNYTAIDACTNFDELVCGGWVAKHDYRPDQSAISTASYMDDEIDNLMREILETPYATNSTPPGGSIETDKANFQLVQDTYKACMDEAGIKAVGVKPLKDITDMILKQFPASSTGAVSTTELTDILLFLVGKYGVSGLISAGTGADDKFPDTVTISVGSGSVGLPAKSYYNNTGIVANYTRTIGEMFSIILGNSSTGYGELAKNIVALEKSIMKAKLDPEDASDITKTYNPMQLANIDKLIPEISISKYVMSQVPKGYNNTRAIVSNPGYYPALSAILKDTSRETLQGYFLWETIRAWVGRLHKDFRTPLIKFNNELNGRASDVVSERWRICLGEAQNNLPWIYSESYVQHAFSPEAKQFGDRIIMDIKGVFTQKLNTLDWMSASVKALAANKVRNIVQKIGYPTKSPNVLDPQSLKTWYSALTGISSTSYFTNGIAFTTFYNTRSWADLLKPTDKDFWYMTAAEINAYYNPSSNEIAFPAGIMQRPLFGVDLPEYVSYGAFGSIAGHELSHGFDDNGRLYNENGTYDDWWDNSTISAFTKKSSCFVDQYGKFTVEGLDGKPLNVNGKLTLGENIADAGGVSASHAAWTLRNAKSPNPALPGLTSFSNSQLFFVSYATWWCSKTKKQVEANRVLTDPHSPNKARILYTLQNSRAFREAFKCPVKEPTCELW